MRFVLPLITVCAAWAAAPKPIVNPEPNARFRDLVALADRCVLTSAGQHPNDLKNQRLLLDIEGVGNVARIAAFFRFTGEYTSAFETELDGEQVWAISNCLCTGSHMISFIRDNREMVAMSLHHWTHVRPSRGWKSQDVNLTKESSDQIRAFLLASITPAKEAKAASNQTPKPAAPATPQEKSTR